MFGKGAVLVIEREHLVARDLSELLTSEGYEVPACAGSGAEALRLAERLRPDVAVLDVEVDGEGSGLALAERLRDQLRIPVLLLSSGVEGAHVAAGGASEPFGMLVKPFRARELLAALGATLNRARLEHRVHHLNAVLRAIRGINRLIVKERDRDRLLAGACRLLVTTRSYEWAWIALVDGPGHPVSFAHASVEPRQVAMRELADAVRAGYLPERARLALASPSPMVLRVPWDECADCPLRERHRATGGLVARLHHAGRKRGVLCVALAADLLDDAEELALFQELADDLAYALTSLDHQSARKLAEAALERSRDELRDLAAHLQVFADDERKAVAREIHDELGQVLTAISFDVTTLKRGLCGASAELQQRVEGIGGLVGDALRVVRRVSTGLRPVVLDELGLCAAICWQVKEVEKRLGIRCVVSVPEQDPQVSEAQALGVFRICQEALTNVARHAHATRVTVRVLATRQAIELSVRDNGVGFASGGTTATSHGLLGMRERARSLGGQLVIDGRAGRGTRVTVRVPLTGEGGHGARTGS